MCHCGLIVVGSSLTNNVDQRSRRRFVGIESSDFRCIYRIRSPRSELRAKMVRKMLSNCMDAACGCICQKHLALCTLCWAQTNSVCLGNVSKYHPEHHVSGEFVSLSILKISANSDISKAAPLECRCNPLNTNYIQIKHCDLAIVGVDRSFNNTLRRCPQLSNTCLLPARSTNIPWFRTCIRASFSTSPEYYCRASLCLGTSCNKWS